MPLIGIQWPFLVADRILFVYQLLLVFFCKSSWFCNLPEVAQAFFSILLCVVSFGHKCCEGEKCIVKTDAELHLFPKVHLPVEGLSHIHCLPRQIWGHLVYQKSVWISRTQGWKYNPPNTLFTQYPCSIPLLEGVTVKQVRGSGDLYTAMISCLHG